MVSTNRSVKDIERIIAWNEEHPVRSKIIVPNVSWGFFTKHEADLVVINKSLYLTEYEIKRSFEDFKADFRKKDYHNDDRISQLWYAVPESIADRCKEYLESQYDNKCTEHAGIYAYNDENWTLKQVLPCNYAKGKRIYIEDALEIARLGTLRQWKDL